MAHLPDSTGRVEHQVVEDRSPDLVNTMTLLFARSETFAQSVVLAIRGDRLALVFGASDDGPQLIVGLASPTGELESLERWEADQLAAACDRLNDMYLVLLGDAAPACFPTLAEWARVARDSSQLDRLAAILADDLTGDSYEVLGQLSQQTKRDMLDYYVATADLPGLGVTRKIHAASDHAVVASVANVAGLDTGALTETLIVNHVVERDGQIARLDQWEIEDLPLALDRFDRSLTR
jgi:hypothetical protein